MSVYVDVRAWINPQALKLPWLPNADSTGTGCGDLSGDDHSRLVRRAGDLLRACAAKRGRSTPVEVDLKRCFFVYSLVV